MYAFIYKFSRSWVAPVRYGSWWGFILRQREHLDGLRCAGVWGGGEEWWHVYGHVYPYYRVHTGLNTAPLYIGSNPAHSALMNMPEHGGSTPARSTPSLHSPLTPRSISRFSCIISNVRGILVTLKTGEKGKKIKNSKLLFHSALCRLIVSMFAVLRRSTYYANYMQRECWHTQILGMVQVDRHKVWFWHLLGHTTMTTSNRDFVTGYTWCLIAYRLPSCDFDAFAYSTTNDFVRTTISPGLPRGSD